MHTISSRSKSVHKNNEAIKKLTTVEVLVILYP